MHAINVKTVSDFREIGPPQNLFRRFVVEKLICKFLKPIYNNFLLIVCKILIPVWNWLV